MEPTEILAMAQTAAQLIRMTQDREKTLTAAYAIFEREPPADQEEAIAIRITRLLTNAGEHRREVLDFLRSQANGLLNRPVGGWSGDPNHSQIEPDPEAVALVEYVAKAEENARDILPKTFGAFSLARQSIMATFGGQMIVERDGNKLRAEDAGPARASDRYRFEKEGLPPSVRGLIDYPLEVPVVFTIETGQEPWSVWDICCAFGNQYAAVYENPQRYGIWGHDLTDLCIERLLYFPNKRLIYPHVGS